MATEYADRSRTGVKAASLMELDTATHQADRAFVLTAEQRSEVEAICEEICERLETSTEYVYSLGERRGKAGEFAEFVWSEALCSLRVVGFEATQTDTLIRVRRR